MIITIDGPVATGKSTVAKKLAKEVGFIYFDTGALYRCIAYAIKKHKVDINNVEKLSKFLETFDFDIKIYHGQRQYFVDGKDVSLEIRHHDVAAIASNVATLAPVRQKLTNIQRRMAEGVNAVFEGRDMGAEVFPSADLKIFLSGRPEVRAQRRLTELREKFPEDAKNLTLDDMIKRLDERDTLDSTREVSPLRQADDAQVIDTSDISIDDVIFKILEYYDRKRINET